MGYVHGARAALRVMRDQGSGTLINVSSIVGVVSQPYTRAYGMSKYAIRALSASLRQELRLDKARASTRARCCPPRSTHRCSSTPRTTPGARRWRCRRSTVPSAWRGPSWTWCACRVVRSWPVRWAAPWCWSPGSCRERWSG
ncbi:MAG TPA: SDR family NAD(P)-dependent oxidoreductase [Streptomyces sp.]|nr:SDR family NAD(P)-dependent oxidoreductase [Streptomyces sp.]